MPHQTSPAGRILVGTDGSPASVAAVRWAAREARLRGLRVHVVYVRDRRLPMPHYAPQPRAAEAPLGAAAGESTLKAVVQEALGSRPVVGAQTGVVPMDAVPMDAVPMDTVPMDAVQMELAEGAPARVLLERSVGAEMLVLGSTRPGPGPAGRAGAASAAAPAPQSRPPLGPVARDCLHAAACPVVVVRPGEARAAAEPVHA
jgi:nucleotide-binding universal stress UspA family protein